MPENAYRRAHLYAHAAGRYRTVPDRQRDYARLVHHDWPLCARGCGWPVNPAALEPDYTDHPGCEARP